MIVSSVLMTAGCGAISIARVDNLSQLWGILVVAGLGIGGIVVPASIITSKWRHHRKARKCLNTGWWGLA
jgi:hypothetical protein